MGKPKLVKDIRIHGSEICNDQVASMNGTYDIFEDVLLTLYVVGTLNIVSNFNENTTY